MGWGLNTAESTVQAAFETTLPAVIVLERPIAMVDSLLCRSLDIVEERIPVVTLPPALVSAKKNCCVCLLQNLFWLFSCHKSSVLYHRHDQTLIVDLEIQRDVRGSVHHSKILTEITNKIKILLFHIYMKLNMFRPTHRPSSGA